MTAPADAASETAWLSDLAEVLVARGLLHSAKDVRFERLTGGVSSDIWALRGENEVLVVKRALAQLRVAQLWRAPVTRNAAEAAWLGAVHDIDADFAPAVLYHDAAAGLFVMPYIPPATAPVWKAELLAGRCDVAFAAEVGRRVGRVHAATAGRADIAARFANDAAFHDLRLAPYLLATAARHPALAPRLGALAAASAAARDCLIHGDVSPKNILMGPRGPILLDAECATYGDAAFDLAFCLNHLLLKALVVPDPAPLRAAFAALADAYFASATFAPRAILEARAAALLPGLFLARVDGKSPVEYITADAERARVRAVASHFLRTPTDRLGAIYARWEETLKDAAP
jgi:aminoglycoside phosphotransferase (APT) family kinase protein